MKVTVWNENCHEKMDPVVAGIYPEGIHGCIAGFLKADDVEVRTATLDEPECGLTEEVLADTDVLIWWGHCAHDLVPDEIVERVQQYVWKGMGLIVLHSGHKSKIFMKMMGTSGDLKWYEESKERIWTIIPNHPIAAGVPETLCWKKKKCTENSSSFPNRWKLFLSAGLRAAKSSEAAVPG